MPFTYFCSTICNYYYDKEIDNTMNELDCLFREHPFLATAFSGFGVSIIALLGRLIYKHIGINKKKKVVHTNKQISSQSQTSRLEDIQAIQVAITTGSSQKKEQQYFRFFNKYKSHFSPDDIDSLIQESSVSYPNYSRLLSKLSGLIEAIEE